MFFVELFETIVFTRINEDHEKMEAIVTTKMINENVTNFDDIFYMADLAEIDDFKRE